MRRYGKGSSTLLTANTRFLASLSEVTTRVHDCSLLSLRDIRKLLPVGLEKVKVVSGVVIDSLKWLAH